MITVKLEIDNKVTVTHNIISKKEDAEALKLAQAILLLFHGSDNHIKVTFNKGKNAVI